MAALTLSELQSLRDALVRARLGGVRSIRDQNGEEVTYKSDREMAAALASVESQIAALQSGSVPNVFRFKTSKGL
ncbi:MAG: phage head-tail joining protein [Hyphomonadaceae bacterium]